MQKRKIAILGCTGSIGSSAIEVIRANENLELVGLSVNKSYREMFKLAKEFGVRFLHIASSKIYDQATEHLPSEAKLFRGEAGLGEFIEITDADIVLSGIAGAAGLPATLSVLRTGKTLALANKESLVVAGDLVKKVSRENKAQIIPVDSEHSAIYRLLRGQTKKSVRKIILTASGGAFLNRDLSSLKNITPAEATSHPNWSMGKKITVDSSTMFNKALEIIEAHYLFDMPASKIKAIIHPQSIVHGLVEFTDGSMKADLSTPDMKVPIQYALQYPNSPEVNYQSLSLSKIGKLDFQEIDQKRFPVLQLGYEIIRKKYGAGAITNAADEEAVRLFLEEKIPYLAITRLVSKVLSAAPKFNEQSLDDLQAADQWARVRVKEFAQHDVK